MKGIDSFISEKHCFENIFLTIKKILDLTNSLQK